jgi:hypothetical protein
MLNFHVSRKIALDNITELKYIFIMQYFDIQWKIFSRNLMW